MKSPVKFWRILIGPWLYRIINVVYEKYHRLLQAKKQKSGPLLTLKEEYSYVPPDTGDFLKALTQSEIYNLYIVMLTARFINFPVREVGLGQELSFPTKSFYSREVKQPSLKFKAYKFLLKTFHRYGNIFLYHTGHPSKFAFELFLRSKGKIIEFPLLESHLPYLDYDKKVRKKLSQLIVNELSITKKSLLNPLIATVTSHQIPVCFLEGFRELQSAAQEIFGSKIPQKIISSIGWYADEVFKVWAASCFLKGTTLIGLQHGGNYGISQWHFPGAHEIEITDKYFTWGWRKENTRSKFFPSPSQILLDINKVKLEKKPSDEILYVTTSGFRFLREFPAIPELFFPYHNNQKDFMGFLSPLLRKRIRIRTHADDVWEIRERLATKFKDLQFEDWSVPFRKSLTKAKIVIIDHLSTTYLEVLASNIPVILFWDPYILPIQDFTKPYFEKLEEVGILYKNGEEAARFLSKIEGNIQEWWQNPTLQKVIREFCTLFAKKSGFPLKEWYELLINA